MKAYNTIMDKEKKIELTEEKLQKISGGMVGEEAEQGGIIIPISLRPDALAEQFVNDFKNYPYEVRLYDSADKTANGKIYEEVLALDRSGFVQVFMNQYDSEFLRLINRYEVY